MLHSTRIIGVAALAATLAAPIAAAHGTKDHGGQTAKPAGLVEQKTFGRAGDPSRVDRTIHIRMTDQMRFEPSKISVRAGETLRLVHHNSGKVMHEMVIGTRVDLEEHAALMRKNPGMEHDEPYMTHVASGKEGEVVWQFNRAGEFEFACLIPGHFEAGMRGTIVVAAK